MSPQESFDESTHPAKFQLEDIQKAVENLHLCHEQPDQSETTRKRRKLSKPSIDHSFEVRRQIYDALQVAESDDDEVAVFEQLFL